MIDYSMMPTLIKVGYLLPAPFQLVLFAAFFVVESSFLIPRTVAHSLRGAVLAFVYPQTGQLR